MQHLYKERMDEMTNNFLYEQNRIYMEDENHKLLAEVTFPSIDNQTVAINHTFVDHSLRGQGIAGDLLEATVGYLAEHNLKAIPTCSYALSWFDKHDEYHNILD